DEKAAYLAYFEDLALHLAKTIKILMRFYMKYQDREETWGNNSGFERYLWMLSDHKLEISSRVRLGYDREE
ncbi:MAG: hypothetical protein K0Q99_624, partial [Clostridia bacterium]|nr:hypothetical protein [Clostridia bacterium]